MKSSPMHPLTLILAIIIFALPVVDTAGDEVRGYPTLETRPVTFWSDGTRLAGDLTYPKDIKDGEKLPVIVFCHGWGGTKQHLNFQIAPRFAKEGFVAFTFDYRGWGESDSRLVVEGDMPKPDKEGYVTVKARAIRDLVDPADQQEDIEAAISFVEGESIVDADRIGIWGSSFGGGHVIYRAAIDDRIKCVVAQVGAMNQHPGDAQAVILHGQKIQRVRGELEGQGAVPQGVDKQQGLSGTPYFERFVGFSPVNMTDDIDCPVLMIDADGEHYFNIKEHSGLVYARLKGKVPVEYHVLEGITHYGVYSGEPLNLVMKLEVPWVLKHLKGE
ncbi:MAG: alpha/beta fold hydrolase [Pirellulaceae bacterium]